jgi:organic radical activating enzyme
MSTPTFAALAGVPAGIQAQGVWIGRRQLFVRFAGEAETATMFTGDALAKDLRRQLERSPFHSVSITGRDPLGNVPFLTDALGKAALTVPVMLDTDGQRPAEVAALLPHLALLQVTMECGHEAALDHALATLRAAADAGVAHAFVAIAHPETTDAQLLRAVEEIAAACPTTDVVILPPQSPEPTLDRRWGALLEPALRAHPRVQLGARIAAPSGMR